jgi:hypothetical protein
MVIHLPSLICRPGTAFTWSSSVRLVCADHLAGLPLPARRVVGHQSHGLRWLSPEHLQEELRRLLQAHVRSKDDARTTVAGQHCQNLVFRESVGRTMR